MCLILIRNPGVEIDYINIEAAAENNPHGWGYVIPDRGKLEIRRHYDAKGTDPDDVMRVIEDNQNNQLFLHLRFCTHGDKSKANVHPFPALQKRKDGMQVWVMHNGTVAGYKDAGALSDTYHFTNKMINPLLRRFMAFNGKEHLLRDPMLGEIIEKYAGSWSKFVLIDEYGNHRIIGDGHVAKPGLWLSNEYSFKPKYRYPKKEEKETTIWEDYQYGNGYSYSTNYGQAYRTQAEKEEEYAEFWPKKDEDDEKTYTPPFPQEATDGGTDDQDGTSYVAKGKELVPISDPKLEEPIDLSTKETFCDLLGLKDIREVAYLSEEDVFELVCEYPEHIVLLIRDLILALDNDE